MMKPINDFFGKWNQQRKEEECKMKKQMEQLLNDQLTSNEKNLEVIKKLKEELEIAQNIIAATRAEANKLNLIRDILRPDNNDDKTLTYEKYRQNNPFNCEDFEKGCMIEIENKLIQGIKLNGMDEIENKLREVNLNRMVTTTKMSTAPILNQDKEDAEKWRNLCPEDWQRIKKDKLEREATVLTCKICLDNRVELFGHCGHMICKDCYGNLRGRAKKCPFCRATFKRSAVSDIHFV
jgi:hypothetical protein